MEMWELTARERIRDSLALYTWSGDALRLSELAGAFCVDGVLEIRGGDSHRGRQAIVDFLSGGSMPVGDEALREARRADAAAGRRRIVRHNVANIRFLELTPTEALVACYFTVFTEMGLDHYGRYRDTLVPEGDHWLIRHRYVSTDWRSPDSTMAGPPVPTIPD